MCVCVCVCKVSGGDAGSGTRERERAQGREGGRKWWGRGAGVGDVTVSGWSLGGCHGDGAESVSGVG